MHSVICVNVHDFIHGYIYQILYLILLYKIQIKKILLVVTILKMETKKEDVDKNLVVLFIQEKNNFVLYKKIKKMIIKTEIELYKISPLNLLYTFRLF